MMDTFQAVKETISKELTSSPLPRFLEKGIDLLTSTHFYYRIYKHIRNYQKGAREPLDQHPALYGAALHLVARSTQIGDYALKLALATKCTLDLLGEYRQLGNSWQRLCRAVDSSYPLYIPVRLKETNKQAIHLLSPQQFVLWRVQIIKFSRQITLIACCALEVFLQLFKLSMCLCEAKLLLLNNDPHMQFESCTELFANWKEYQKELQHNVNKIAEVIHQGCQVADGLLKGVGIDRTGSSIAEEFIEGFGKKELRDKRKKAPKNSFVENLKNVGEVIARRYYTPGKITPFHIDHGEGHTAQPTLPYDRYPPWGGEKIEGIWPSVSTKETEEEPNWNESGSEWKAPSLGIVENFLNSTFSIFTSEHSLLLSPKSEKK